MKRDPNDPDPLKLGLNSVQKWAQWHDQRDREVEAARLQREKYERAHSAELAAVQSAQMRSALEPRVAELEAEVASLQTALADVAGVVTDLFNDLTEQRGNLAAKERDEMRDLRAEIAKLSSLLAEQRGSESFRFAREKDTPIDVPAFLPPRRDVN
jgi:hypothetical protein